MTIIKNQLTYFYIFFLRKMFSIMRNYKNNMTRHYSSTDGQNYKILNYHFFVKILNNSINDCLVKLIQIQIHRNYLHSLSQ